MKHLYSAIGIKGGCMASRISMALLLLVICCIGYSPLAVSAEEATGEATGGAPANPIQIKDPASDLWREVRQRDQLTSSATTQVRGVDTGVLINEYGEKWREFRMQHLIPYGGYFLIAILVLLAVYYLVKGKVTVSAGKSSRQVQRYTLYERTIHWFMAVVFIFLALTGLVLLFGRATLIPLVGPEVFSYLATFSKVGHDITGLLFALALILIFFKYVGRNFFRKVDFTWLAKGGGFVNQKVHPSAGFFNAGEKIVFWLVVLFGIAITLSGAALLFANLGQGRIFMELSHVVHGITVVFMVGVIFGHIYIGTIGMEGALQGMTTGYVDLNWAKEHHDLWAKEAESEAVPNEEVEKIRGTTVTG